MNALSFYNNNEKILIRGNRIMKGITVAKWVGKNSWLSLHRVSEENKDIYFYKTPHGDEVLGDMKLPWAIAKVQKQLEKDVEKFRRVI